MLQQLQIPSNIVLPEFKINCSAIGKIMGGVETSPTAKQLARLEELKAKEKLTDKQQAERDELQAKVDSKPKLGEGAKTFCKNWVLEQLYQRRKGFSNKYTEKGILCEQSEIDIIAELMGYGVVFKHEGRVSDEYKTGECDMLLPYKVEDVKASWDFTTFPFFDKTPPNSDHVWQGYGYMDLYKRKHYAINYVLVDTPSHLIDKEARNQMYRLGIDEMDADLYDEVAAKMTYNHLPIWQRVRRYEFDYDEKKIELIHNQVKLCREYIKTLITP